MIEKYLPKRILNKAIKSGSEYGWKLSDIIEVTEVARKLDFGILGGQIQYVPYVPR